MLTERRLSLWLFAAFTAVALSFVAASVYSNYLSVEIEGEAHEVTADALPSIQHLTAATDALRDLEAATDDYADLGPAEVPAAKERIAGLWKALDAELTAYDLLPFYPGERELFREVDPALRELDRSIQLLYDKTEQGDREAARTQADRVVRVKANQCASILRRLVAFNASHAFENGLSIERTRRHTVLVAGALDAVTLLLTVGIAVWLWRLFLGFSRLQNAHAELVQRRGDELEVFGRRVAHDLLSPLSSLTYCLSAFKGAAQKDPKLDGALARANQCVRRAQGLVEDVFDFARSGGAPAPDARADVAEVVAQVVEEARAAAVGAGEAVDLQVGELPDGEVRCSRGVLASILGNLVRNAVKYTRDSAERRIVVRGVESAGSVRLEVEDTGPGVPAGLEASIFDPYVRAEGLTQPGLGLGLATVKRFCEAHGGSVGVSSTMGKGSVFHVTLPRAPQVAPRSSLPPVKAVGLRDAS